jgi:hypothetical protein
VLYKVTLYSDIDCDVLIIVSHSTLLFTKNAWVDIISAQMCEWKEVLMLIFHVSLSHTFMVEAPKMWRKKARTHIVPNF